jgi:hypothetical protein
MKVIIAVLTLAVLVSPVLAQASAPKPDADNASLHGYGETDKTCQEWTDGCRTCTRSDSAGAVCPNIGIACQPKPIVCAKRVEPAKPAEPTAEKTKP